MRIRITRSGGLAGIKLTGEFTTDALEPEAAGRTERAVQRLLAQAPGQATPAHPDAFVFEITLPDEERSTSVGESDLPEELRPLIRSLSIPRPAGSSEPAGE